MKIFTRIAVFAIILFTSCKDDSAFLGVGFLPSSRLLITSKVDTLTINTFVVQQSPKLMSGIVGAGNLGSINDPVFGKTQASLVIQFAQSEFIGLLGNDYKPQSLKLYIKKTQFIGDKTAKHTLHVHSLTNFLSPTTTYKTDYSPIYEPQDLANASVVSLNDSIICVTLDNSLRDSLFNLDPSVYKNVYKFVQKFYGLYITVDPFVTGGGGLSFFNFSDVALSLVYKKTDETLDSMLYYSSYIIRDTLSPYNSNRPYDTLVNLALFKNDYTGTKLESYIEPDGSSLQSDSLLFVHTLDGATINFQIPYFDKLINLNSTQAPASIHRAELVIPVDSTLLKTSYYSTPENLIPYFYTNEAYPFTGNNYTPNTINTKNFDAYKWQYTIDVTKNVQDFICKRNDQFNYSKFVLYTSATLMNSIMPYYSPRGVVLKKPTLNIYYSTFTK